jgi:hypothetical protein
VNQSPVWKHFHSRWNDIVFSFFALRWLEQGSFQLVAETYVRGMVEKVDKVDKVVFTRVVGCRLCCINIPVVRIRLSIVICRLSPSVVVTPSAEGIGANFLPFFDTHVPEPEPFCIRHQNRNMPPSADTNKTTTRTTMILSTIARPYSPRFICASSLELLA